MRIVTCVDYEAHHEYDIADLFMNWGAKGYKKAYPIEDADMIMLLSTGDIDFENFWNDSDVSDCYQIWEKLEEGETKLHTISNGQVVTIVRE